MAEMTKYEPGIPSWVDLSTTDMEAASAWYGELFGWTAVPQDTQGGPPYTQFMLRDKTVAGMGKQAGQLTAAGVPPTWNTYVSVDDVEAVTAAVKEHGGTVLMPAMKILEAGEMAVFTDPQGAAFCVWKAGDHIGAEVVNEPSSFSWNELATRDVEGAKAFYSNVFGWSIEAADAGGMAYHMLKLGEREVGGMMEMGESFDANIPPHWAVYFSVADIEAAVKKVKDTGGSVHVPPMKIGVGTFSVVADPQGATFTLFQGA